MPKRWVPLESNPDVLNDYAKKLGLDIDKYSFGDVYGLDPELLAMVPQPCIALVLLFPITKASEEAREQQQQELTNKQPSVPDDLFYMKQTIGNACGTIGILHALGNQQHLISFEKGSFLQDFLSKTATMTPSARGAYLENPPDDAPDIDKAHAAAAQAGATAAPQAEENTNLHFVCLTHKDHRLFELDGRKSFPIDHGSTSESTFLQDAAKVVQAFIAASDSHNFNVISLSAIGN